jgi:hypothetical protein
MIAEYFTEKTGYSREITASSRDDESRSWLSRLLGHEMRYFTCGALCEVSTRSLVDDIVVIRHIPFSGVIFRVNRNRYHMR